MIYKAPTLLGLGTLGISRCLNHW